VLEGGSYVQRAHDDEVVLTIMDGVRVKLAEVW
jgi:hypothetical protein